MGISTPRIVMAERISGTDSWAASLAELMAERSCRLETLDDGQALLRLLTGSDGKADLVVTGRELDSLDALDALYLADKAHREAGHKRSEWPVRALLVVTNVRADFEFHDFLRRRGATGFLHPSDDLRKTVDELCLHAYGAVRAEARVPVRLEGRIVRQGEAFRGTLTDLSASGGRFELPARSLESSMTLGEEMILRFSSEPKAPHGEQLEIGTMVKGSTIQVECRAEVRQVELRRRFFGDRIECGLRFLDLDGETKNSIDRLLRIAAGG